MGRIKAHQIPLLDILSRVLFGGEQVQVPVTPEVLREAREQAVLTLIDMPKDFISGYYSMYTQRLAHNVRVDCEHFESH